MWDQWGSHNLETALFHRPSTYLNVSQKVAVNVMHPVECVVRQAEGMELIEPMVIRNVKLIFKKKRTQHDIDV